MLRAVLSCLLLGPSVALAQLERISATVTVTAAPTTSGQSLTINSAVRRWTNNPAQNPAVWIQTNATAVGSATNLFLHLSTYRPSSSIGTVYASSNAVKLVGPVGGTLNVSAAGGWATIVLSTQLVTTPFSVPVRVPLDLESLPNAAQVANLLVDGLGKYATGSLVSVALSLGQSNATVKPVYADQTTNTLRFRALEQGSNIVLFNTPTSVVVNGSSAGTVTGAVNLAISNSVITPIYLDSVSNALRFLSIENWTNTVLTRTPTSILVAAEVSLAALSKKQVGSFALTNLASGANNAAVLTNLANTGADTNRHHWLSGGPTNGSPGGLILQFGSSFLLTTNNGTNVGVSLSGASTNRQTTMVHNGSASTNGWQLVGDSALTNAGIMLGVSPAASRGTCQQWENVNAAGDHVGFAGSLLYRTGRNIHLWARVHVDPTFNGWVGLADTTFSLLVQTNDPSAFNLAAFKFNGCVDASWTPYTADGAVSTIGSASGLAAYDDPGHLLEIQFNDGAANVVFKIDGTTLATHTTHLPSASTNLRFIAGTKGRDLSCFSDGTNDLQMEWVTIQSDR